MAAGTAMLGAAGIGAASSYLSGKSASKEAKAARALSDKYNAQAQERIEEAVTRLKEMGVPDTEAQRIALESPELVGLQDVVEAGPSAYEDIQEDPRLKAGQMQSLADIQELADKGVTAGERAQSQLDTRQVGAEAQARQKAVLQNMAQRGVEGSGLELAAQLQGNQGSADRRAMMMAQMIKDREARKLAAQAQAGALSGQIRGQEFGQAAQGASAADRIAAFNAQNRMAIEGGNLDRQQQIENQRAAAAQQQEIHNKGLIQQDFQNRFGREQAIAGALTGQASGLQQQAGQELQAGQAAAQGRLQQGAAITGLAGNLAGAYAQSQGKTSPGGTNSISIPSADQYKMPELGSSTFKADGGIVRANEMVKTREDGLYADGGMVLPQEAPMQPAQVMNPNNQGGYADGGLWSKYAQGGVAPCDMKYAGGGIELMAEESEIIPGDDFAGDRVDAKINSGEMVLNVEQQQRLMELLKGLRDLKGLGDENIVEPVPVGNPEVELPSPDSLPPELTPEMLASMAPPQAEFKQGGIVKEYEPLARGLTAEHKKMTSQSEQMKEAQKNTNARVKAIETLLGYDGKKK